MKIKGTKHYLNIALLVLSLFLLAGISSFMYNSTQSYKINNSFVSLPLQFDPEDASSTYQAKSAEVTVYGGFIKVAENTLKVTFAIDPAEVSSNPIWY